MKLKTSILLILLICFTFGNQALASETYHLHAKGYGPVKIGMTVEEAAKLLATKMKTDLADSDGIDCYYVYPEGYSVAFMVSGERITRIDVYDNKIATEEGITVGDDESVIYETYKTGISEKPHPYLDDEGKYIIVSSGSDYQMIFETFKGKITSFRSGELPFVEYIEGCL